MRSLPRGLLAGAILVAIAAGSCRHESTLRMRYLPGLVPATEHVLSPATVAVLPATGSLAAGEIKVGAIYKPDGSVKTPLSTRDVGAIVTQAVARCLSDAGLKASIGVPENADSSAFTLATAIESISIDKHFAAEQTIHGQYFTMVAQVKLRFALSSREHPNLYTGVTTGTETEPPAPVGGEVFLPIETEPAESLSVAMSRAIAELILQPEFRKALSG